LEQQFNYKSLEDHGVVQTSEFRTGWPLVLCGVLAVAIAPPTILFHSLGVFAPALISQFGWRMAQLQGGLAAMSIAMLVCGPLVGLIADRYGVRRVALASMPLLGLTVMAFSLMTGAIIQFYLLCIAVALFGAGVTPIIWTRAVNRHFNVRRGLALGLTLSGTGLFALIAKPSLAAITHDHGWRAAYLALGAIPMLLLPIVAFGLRRGAQSSATADANTSLAHAPAIAPDPASGLSVRQVLSHWRFWVLFLSFMFAAFATAGPIPNLERIIIQQGSDLAHAVAVTSLIGVSIVVGRLGGGWLFDRFWAPAIGAVMLLLPAISGMVLAQHAISPHSALLAVVFLGIGAGAEWDLLAYLVARYVGMRRYGSVYGFLFAAFGVVGGTAPAAYGAVFDRTGSYGPGLLAGSAGLIIAACALLFLGRYPDFAVHQSKSSPGGAGRDATQGNLAATVAGP
jgi:MFS family permease